ncbi:MAG: Carnitine transport binding protein OpuCC [Chlamydiae bacterium]|nr:Carnitine transport binding protein OpuCC [Chlamydiota bacterium]
MKELQFKLRILIVVLIFLTTAIALSLGTFRHRHDIAIGGKICTEQRILGEILAQLIEKNTSLKVNRSFNLEGTAICFNALKSGSIDLYCEYTATALLDILKEPLMEGSLYPHVKQAFEEKYNLIWLDRLGFCNQYVLIARANSNLKSISDIQPHHKIAFDPEIAARPEMTLLKSSYPQINQSKLMDQVLLYFSLQSGGMDVVSGFSTDGRLVDKRFTILKDDKNCLSDYEVAPVISKKCLNKHPELIPVLSLLAGKISNEQMSMLNYQVEIQKRDVAQVATEFLQNAILSP